MLVGWCEQSTENARKDVNSKVGGWQWKPKERVEVGSVKKGVLLKGENVEERRRSIRA